MTANLHDVGGLYFEELRVGMKETLNRTFTDTDMKSFIDVSGDTNPIHLDDEFAKQNAFKSRLVNGLLTASLISAALGTKLPGPGCIYMHQTLKFLAPVYINDTVKAIVRILELNTEKHHALMETTCYVNDTIVIEGEALLKVPSQTG